MKKKSSKKKNRITGFFVNNWSLKLFSLVAALLLWFLFMTIEDPESEKTFYNIPVKLVNTDLLTDAGMVYEVLDKTDTIRTVTVTAPQSTRNELVTGDIVAEADFANLTVTNTVEIRFYSLRYNDKISNISGSTEILRLNIEEKKSTRLFVEVTTSGEVKDGYLIKNVSTDQNRIEVSGPDSVISQIARASVTVDVSDSTSDISTYADVVLYDADGKRIPTDNLIMTVDSVLVRVQILAAKTVPVYFSVMGTPAAGYLYTGEITADPSEISIAGEPELLESIRAISIPAEALNITGQTDDLLVNINVSEYLPEGIQLADKTFRGKISVTVHIEPEETATIKVPVNHVRIVDVPAGYEAILEETEGTYSMEVMGLRTALEELDGNQLYGRISLTAFMERENMTEPEPGVYTAEVELVLPEDVAVTVPMRAHIIITKPEDAE